MLKLFNIKHSYIGHFILLALSLFLFNPAPASAAITACDTAAGEFQYPLITGSCYICPDGYNHDILYPPSDVRSCFKIGEETTAHTSGQVQFLCPEGQFANLISGKCNSCPVGYIASLDGETCTLATHLTASYDSPFQTCTGDSFDGLDGSCYTCPVGSTRDLLSTNCIKNISATHHYNIGCDSGFDGLNGSCYTCPSGYSRIGLSTSCTQTLNASYQSAFNFCNGAGEFADNGTCYSCPAGYNRDPFTLQCSKLLVTNSPMTECGALILNGTNVEISPGVFFFMPDGTFSYTGCGANPTPIGVEGPFDNKFYSCPAGYGTNIFPAYDAAEKCTFTGTSTVNASKLSALACASGTFDGLNGSCYTCPSGYTRDGLSLQCLRNIDASYVSPFQTCTGDTFDGFDGACYSCPTGSR
ncbi:MAG: hypothetical protein GQ582_11730, partial [Methyloprofundus sp.]|nr:hypothetical protein [Methyloprofundus sp.]